MESLFRKPLKGKGHQGQNQGNEGRGLCGLCDRIEYCVPIQISALQDGVSARERSCVCACAVEIKPGVLRASLMYAYALQDGNLF